MQLLNQILIYIQSLGIHLDENSYLYARLVTHLKLLLNRILSGECEEHAGFARSLSESLASEHLQGWEYARSIYSFMSEQLQLRVHQEEITYLAMHIVPLLQRGEGKNNDEDNVHTQEGGKEKTDVKIQTTGSRHH